MMGLNLFSRTRTAPAATPTDRPPPPPGDPRDADAGLSPEHALQQGRLGLIVMTPPELREDRRFRDVHARAAAQIDKQYALVPEGLASLPMSIFDEAGGPEADVETGPFLLSRRAVTNAEYQRFVDGGGYEDLALWPEEIWPHLVAFRDQSGAQGPRYWEDGRHDRKLSNHPVVGVCFYEAQAYACWAGFRLPNEAEWQMAATWRVRTAANNDRRYPWGDSFNPNCCNIWASAHGGLLPVDACPRGAAPNGVLQLIGNVWEWTGSTFEATDRDGRPIVGDTLLKCVRGGAYDTYFAWQATGTFRSAMPALSRVHNTGFRCALDLPTE